MEKKYQNSFIWVGMRIGFFVMIALWFVSFFSPENWDIFVFTILIASILFTFVLSILHLINYKEKNLAVLILVISSLGIIFWFFILVFTYMASYVTF